MEKIIKSLVYSYNCTSNESTRLSPFELMFGQNPRLPIDAVFESVREDPTTGLLNKTAIEYIQDLQQVERQAEEELRQESEAC